MKVLIVKTSSLGDIIHAFPVVSYLKKKFPSILIDWAVEESFSDLVRAHPDIHCVLTVRTRAWRKKLFSRQTWREVLKFRSDLQECDYDYVIDLQGNMKSGWLTWMSNSQNKIGFGFKTAPEWPNCLATQKRFNPPFGRNIREDYLYLVQKFFNDKQEIDASPVALKMTAEQAALLSGLLSNPLLQGKRKVMICPGSAWPNKQMSPESLVGVLQQLQLEMPTVFLLVWGTPDEQQIVKGLHEQCPEASLIIDKMPLPMLQNMMGRMDLVVAMDSLPLHLAGTSGAPTWGIFGASSAHKYRPLGLQHHSFQGKCPYGKTFEKRCPILRTCPTGACIRNLKADEIFNNKA